jgi:hypothetical protein
MSQNHTPGPWEATERHEYHEIIGPRERSSWYGRKGVWAVAYADTDRDVAEQIANARLISAAPDLLEALEMARGLGCPGCIGDCASASPPIVDCPMRVMSAAISKAKGGAS